MSALSTFATPLRKNLRRARRWVDCHPWLMNHRRSVLASTIPDQQQRELLRRIDPRVAPADTMYAGDGAHYFSVGLSAISCIDALIEQCEKREVRTILDLPCGHGRVLRFLRARFPEASITACDLERRGVDFCATVFGAEPLYSVPDFDALRLTRPFDLIWCGSLLTHLDREPLVSLLRFASRTLTQDGLFIATAAGKRVAERMRSRDASYGLTPTQLDRLTQEFVEQGFGYENYPGSAGYGISLTSLEWLRSAAADAKLECAASKIRGWDDHQDVYAFRIAANGGL